MGPSNKRSRQPANAAEVAAMLSEKTTTNPSSTNGKLPSAGVVRNLEELTAPHIKSFDYFLETGIATACESILPQEMRIGVGVCSCCG